MSPDKVTELVVKHVNNLWAVRGSPNDMTYVSIHFYLSLYYINRLCSLGCLKNWKIDKKKQNNLFRLLLDCQLCYLIKLKYRQEKQSNGFVFLNAQEMFDY